MLNLLKRHKVLCRWCVGWISWYRLVILIDYACMYVCALAYKCALGELATVTRETE